MRKAGGSPERAPEAFPGPWPPAPVTGPGPALCRLEQKTGPALSRAGRSAHGPGVRSQSTAPPSAWAAQGGRCRELPGPCEDTPAAECAHRGPGCGGAGLCWNAPSQPHRGPHWVLPGLGVRAGNGGGRAGWAPPGKVTAHPPARSVCPPALACPPAHPTQRWSVPRATAAQPRRDAPGQGGPGGHRLRAPSRQSTPQAPPRLGA